MSTNRDRLNVAVAAFNAGDLDRYLELYTDDVIVHGYTPEPLDRAGAQAFYGALFAAFPDSCLEALDVIEEDDKIVVRFVQRGHHTGDFQGVPPTGNEIALAGITILRFADGQVVERWSQADMLGLLMQVGALPAPGA